VNDQECRTQRAQIGLAFATMAAFVGLIYALLFHPTAANATGHHDLIIGLTSGLGTVFTLQMNYFFARHRPDGSVNPPIPTQPVIPAKASP
jgi:hypothetical protein